MSESENKIKLFEEKQVRAVWDESAEKWWFAIIDIVAVLTEQPNYAKARNYWKRGRPWIFGAFQTRPIDFRGIGI